MAENSHRISAFLGQDDGFQILRLAAWTLALGLWTLALTRYLAEAFFIRPFFSSPFTVGALALGGAALGLALRLFAPPTLWLRLDRAWPPLLLSVLYLLIPQPTPLMGLVLQVGGLALSVACLLSEQRLRTVALPMLLAVTLGLYLKTLGRAVGQADTFEFQVVAPTLGIAHPTGYPLFILLGKLFSLLPTGSVAWRVNLTSAVAAIATLAILYRLALRITLQPLVAMLVALALAFSRVFWSQAIVAEVYTLNLFFVSTVLLLLWQLLTEETHPSTVSWLAFLLGLSLTNHLTTVLLLPAVALALLSAQSRLDGRQWARAVGLFLLGLSVYAYIPLRWPALHDGRWMKLDEFLAYLTARPFSGALQWGLLASSTRYSLVGRLLLEPFGWAGVALAAVGLAWLATRHLPFALLTGVTFLLYALYGVVYLVGDIAVFMLPAHLLMALWMVAGLNAVLGTARNLPAWSPCLLLAMFALLPLSRIWLNLEAVDQSRRNQAELWGRRVLELPLAPGAAVLADGEKFAPLYYLQRIESLRTDLDLVVHFNESEYRSDLLARLEAGQTVYLTRYLPFLQGYALRSLGDLVEVSKEPLIEPQPSATPVGRTFGSVIQLAAYELWDETLTLYWRTLAAPQGDWVIRLRWVDADGTPVWTSSGSRPVREMYPTNSWPPGVVIADAHPLVPPPWLQAGTYKVQVGLFPPFSEMGLPVDDGQMWLSLVEREIVAEEAAPLSYDARAVLGPAWLTSYDLPIATSAGSVVPVDLGWTSVKEAGAISFEWIDGENHATAAGHVGVMRDTTRSRAHLTAPQQPGVYLLRTRWAGKTSYCRWLAKTTTTCDLTQVEVISKQDWLASFDGRIMLLEARVDSAHLRPGGTLPVVIRWRALQTLAEDYTVTVQLWGPDGRLYGQIDSWPAQGTRPTSSWRPGEEIVDPYLIPLSVDAPPGLYQVVVSWYLLATMERLPVVDSSDTAVADHVILGTVAVPGP